MKAHQTLSTIMTRKPIGVREEDNYYTVLSLLQEHNFHHLLVLNGQEQLSGIISKADLEKVERILNSQTTGKTYTTNTLQNMVAKQIMTPYPTVLHPDDTIGFAADLFLVNRFHALPIVDDEELVGIVTSHDLLKFAFDQIPFTE